MLHSCRRAAHFQSNSSFTLNYCLCSIRILFFYVLFRCHLHSGGKHITSAIWITTENSSVITMKSSKTIWENNWEITASSEMVHYVYHLYRLYSQHNKSKMRTGWYSSMETGLYCIIERFLKPETNTDLQSLKTILLRRFEIFSAILDPPYLFTFTDKYFLLCTTKGTNYSVVPISESPC